MRFKRILLITLSFVTFQTQASSKKKKANPAKEKETWEYSHDDSEVYKDAFFSTPEDPFNIGIKVKKDFDLKHDEYHQEAGEFAKGYTSYSVTFSGGKLCKESERPFRGRLSAKTCPKENEPSCTLKFSKDSIKDNQLKFVKDEKEAFSLLKGLDFGTFDQSLATSYLEAESQFYAKDYKPSKEEIAEGVERGTIEVKEDGKKHIVCMKNKCYIHSNAFHHESNALTEEEMKSEVSHRSNSELDRFYCESNGKKTGVTMSDVVLAVGDYLEVTKLPKVPAKKVETAPEKTPKSDKH